MSEASDGNLKRLFAQAPVVGSDEGFVAQLAIDVAARRSALRVRRVALVVLLSVAAVLLAAVLAPFAPPLTAVSELGGSLLELPDQVGAVAASAGRQPGAVYLGIALAAIALPLAGVAWLSRRA